MDEPRLLSDIDEFKKWIADAQVQKVLSQYAGQYRKEQEFKDTGRHQCPFNAKTIKLPTQALFDFLLPESATVDIAAVPGGAAFKKAAWTWGWGEGMCKTTLTPQGAGLFRLVACGTVELFFASCDDMQKAKLVPPAPPAEGKQKLVAPLATVCECATNLTEQRIQHLKDTHGLCRVYHCQLKGPAAVYIPGGHIVTEHVQAGPTDPLVYGVRKSVFAVSEKSLIAFKAAGAMIAAGNGSTEKHLKVQELMEAAVKEAAAVAKGKHST